MNPTKTYLLIIALGMLFVAGCTTTNDADAGRKPADRQDLLKNQPGYVPPSTNN